MKRILLIAMMFITAAAFAAAQITAPTTDVLGAHLNYGRGCTACHAPHSGASGNGANHSGDTTTGNIALWGEDVGNLVGKTITTGQSEHGSYAETLPGFATGGAEVTGLLTCLSCHDGNYAQGAMMKNAVYEMLPGTYGTFNTIPTLLGNDGTGLGNYLNDHPVGAKAIIGCNTPTAAYYWDCTVSATGTITPGPNMTKFIASYGWFVKPGVINGSTPIVVCTTCHNQHLMNVVPVTNGKNSGLKTGTYATMFFVIGPYNPASGTTGSNQTAQFCRQCHGGESNEMNGSSAGTIF
ncbi:MAG: hypothetical protein WBM14_17600 [Terracidiphilus sp.]|jgi:hypothetical protein